MINRRKTKTVQIGAVKIGSRYPVSIQSMTKTDTANVNATVRQIKALEKQGCEIVRLALRNVSSVSVLGKIKAKVNIPLVADIHFNYRLALAAVAQGVDGLRLNPGNIYRRDEIAEIARACKKRRIPIRVGVNAGSLRKCTEHKIQGKEKLAELMVQSALEYIKILEQCDFSDIIVSLKASDVAATVAAYKGIAQACAYPLHLGITASGLYQQGLVKSAIGIGSLLLAGIGDTIRVSLTAAPQQEIKLTQEILQSLGLRNFAPEIIACPTCGRAQLDVSKIAKQLKSELSTFYSLLTTNRPLTIAIMGCEVNGPGEASQADLGIAGGKNCGILFKQGRIVRKVAQENIVQTLIKEMKAWP